jgi:hypothetical protein
LSLSNKIGWAVIAFCVGVAIFFSAIAKAGSVSLRDRLVMVQPSLQSRIDPAVAPEALADAIVTIPRINREWASLILTVAHHEAALSARIAANQCGDKECDGGRAWGLYQAHKNLHNATVWGSPDIGIQTLEAGKALRRAFYECNGGKRGMKPDWVARTLSSYAGRRCDAEWGGLAKRVATYNRILRKL